MSATNITLSTPHNYDLQGLAEITRESLALLKPWTLLKPSSTDPLLGEIVDKAGKYVTAIQTGVAAAYSGFTVTEEILFLASALPIEDQDDLQQYLVGMMDLAREARENANNAFLAFRNVRVEIIDTMSKLTERTKTSKKQTSNGFPQYDRKDIEVLIKFSEYLSTFADWWDWIKVETDPSLSTKDQPIAFQLDSLTDPETVKRWNHLRSQYTAYVQMIGELEDAEPQFFNRPASPDGSGQISQTKAMILGSTPVSTSSSPIATATASSPDMSKATSPNLTSVNESALIANPTNLPLPTGKIGGEKINAKHLVTHTKNLCIAFFDYFTLKVPRLARRMGKKIVGGRFKNRMVPLPDFSSSAKGHSTSKGRSDEPGATERSTKDIPQNSHNNLHT